MFEPELGGDASLRICDLVGESRHHEFAVVGMDVLERSLADQFFGGVAEQSFGGWAQILERPVPVYDGDDVGRLLD